MRHMNKLKLLFRGRILTPKDGAFEKIGQIWNRDPALQSTNTPYLILCCLGSSDVLLALEYVRDNNLPFSVKAGGHSVDAASASTGVIIYLGDMRGVTVDVHNKLAWVQGGALVCDVDRESYVHGLAVPLGVVPSVGATGLVQCTGYGMLTRMWGFASDNVKEFEVILADGRMVIANHHSHPDLYWGLRGGGGGNLGIITRMTMQLYDMPVFYGGHLVWDMAAIEIVIKRFNEIYPILPRFISMHLSCRNPPPVNEPVVIVTLACMGSASAAQPFVQKFLKELPPPMANMLAETDWAEFQASSRPHDNQLAWYWRTRVVPTTKCVDPAVMALVMKRRPTDHSMVVMEAYANGAQADHPLDWTAAPHRDVGVLVLLGGAWDPHTEAPMRQHVVDWVNASSVSLQPFFTETEFSYAQSIAPGLPSMFRHNTQRLIEVKQKYDPRNVFNSHKWAQYMK